MGCLTPGYWTPQLTACLNYADVSENAFVNLA